jgi:hypothetical protein
MILPLSARGREGVREILPGPSTSSFQLQPGRRDAKEAAQSEHSLCTHFAGPGGSGTGRGALTPRGPATVGNVPPERHDGLMSGARGAKARPAEASMQCRMTAPDA